MEDGAAEGDFVGVLEVVLEAETAGERGDFYRHSGYVVMYVEGGGFAFDGAAEGKNHLGLRPAVGHQGSQPGEQLISCNVRHPNAFEWRNNTAQNVIYSPVLAGILYADDVPNALDYADGTMVALTVGANRTDLSVTEHHAVRAIAGFVAEPDDSVGEMMHVLGGLTQQMQRQAQGAPAAHARQGAEGVSRIRQKL